MAASSALDLRAPTSAGTNENASRPALPTRRVSAAVAGATRDASSAAIAKLKRPASPFLRLSPRKRGPRGQIHRSYEEPGPRFRGDERKLSSFNIGVPPAGCA